MALSVVKEDSRFRVEWQGDSTDWLPETASNRKVVLIFLRWLRDENGKPVFTLHVSDPSSIRKLVNPEIPVSSIQASERWTTFSMALYYYGVPLSVLGKWMGVHKTTILRRMLGLALPLWSLLSGYASRELILFMLIYLFIQQPESGNAPIESIMPEATGMPLYKLLNDPLGILMEGDNVKRNVKRNARMADSVLLHCA